MTLALAAGQLLRLDAPGRLELACDSGRVWVTEEPEARDTWLDAGQSVRLAGRGLAIVEATRAATLRIR
ncbi:MAG: DUF2917 domain-containing protein [Usitatibacter sp.]